MFRCRTAVNRTVLGLTGLVFVCVAAAVVSAVWGRGLPPWGPGFVQRTVLLEEVRSAALGLRPLWSPEVMVTALAVVLVCGLWWSAWQLGDGRRSLLALQVAEGVVRTKALEDAVAWQVTGISGVDSCRARLRGPSGTLRLQLDVRLRPGAAPGTVLPALEVVVAELERTLAPSPVRARVRFGAPHRARGGWAPSRPGGHEAGGCGEYPAGRKTGSQGTGSQRPSSGQHNRAHRRRSTSLQGLIRSAVELRPCEHRTTRRHAAECGPASPPATKATGHRATSLRWPCPRDSSWTEPLRGRSPPHGGGRPPGPSVWHSRSWRRLLPHDRRRPGRCTSAT